MAAARGTRVPSILREPVEQVQARLAAIEAERQRLWKALSTVGRGGRRELGEIAEKLAKQDWPLEELRSRLAAAGAQGVGLAAGLRDGARDRIGQIYGRAVGALGVATRDQVERLGKEMQRLAKQLQQLKRGGSSARRTNHHPESRRTRH